MKLFRSAAVLTALSAVMLLSAPDKARAVLTDDFSIVSSFSPTVLVGAQSRVNLSNPTTTTLAPGTTVTLGFDTLQDFSTSATKIYLDTYSPTSYTLTTIITDVDSGQTETLTIKGSLAGFIGHPTHGGAYKGSLNNTYLTVSGLNNTTLATTSASGMNPVTFTLGANTYTFNLTGFTSGGGPAGFHQTGSTGSFTGFVDSTPAMVPEPSSAVLCGLGGLSILGILRRRKATV